MKLQTFYSDFQCSSRQQQPESEAAFSLLLIFISLFCFLALWGTNGQ